MEMHVIEKWFVNSRLWSRIIKGWMMPGLFSLTEPEIGLLKGKVLELGAGQGVTSECLLERYPDIALTALDYDGEQVARMKSRLAPWGSRVHPVQGDATRLAYRANTFEAVIELNAFHHIKNFEAAMQESYRVLKPGGVFIAKDVAMLLTTFIEPWSAEGFFTKRSFKECLSQAGFAVRKSKGLVWFMIVGQKPAKEKTACVKSAEKLRQKNFKSAC